MSAPDDIALTVPTEPTPEPPEAAVAMPLTARALLDIRIPYGAPNWAEISTAKRILEEEINYAKVLGRRGAPLDAEWMKDETDPRLEAYRKVAIETAEAAAKILGDWHSAIHYGESGRHLTQESLTQILGAARQVEATVSRVLGVPKTTWRMGPALERIAALAHGSEPKALDKIAAIAAEALGS